MVRRVLLASILLGACNLCHDRCAAGIQPIGGTADDFRWEEARVAGVAVDGPRACGEADVEPERQKNEEGRAPLGVRPSNRLSSEA